MTLLEEIGFKRSLYEPFLVKWKNKAKVKIIYLGVHVDNVSCIFNGIEINQALKKLKTKLTVKEIGPLKKYFWCKVVYKGNKVWITQNALIKKLNAKFMSSYCVFWVPIT